MGKRGANSSRRPSQAPLALRRVEGNLAATQQATWAWFAVPPVRWAFRADSERIPASTFGGQVLVALSGGTTQLGY